MNGLSDLLEFFEGMAQLWIDNRCGFIAVALYIFIFLTFLLLWLLGFMRGFGYLLDRLVSTTGPVAYNLRRLRGYFSRGVEISKKTKNGEEEISIKLASPQTIERDENHVSIEANGED